MTKTSKKTQTLAALATVMRTQAKIARIEAAILALIEARDSAVDLIAHQLRERVDELQTERDAARRKLMEG